MAKLDPIERPEPSEKEEGRLRRAQEERAGLRPYARCRECHCSIPETRQRNAKYCSRRCLNRKKTRDRKRLVAEIRVGFLREQPRPCRAPDCNNDVPPEKRSNVLYCSNRCRGRHHHQIHAERKKQAARSATLDRRAALNPRVCEASDCDNRIGLNKRIHARFCSRRCRERVGQRRRYKRRKKGGA